MQPRSIPTEVAGDRVRFAENQPEYTPVDVAVQHNHRYDCRELVTAWMPTDEELQRFATLVQHQLEMDGMVPEPAVPAPRIVRALQLAFARWPVLFSHLTSGPLVPHNLHLGSSAELEDPARAP